MDRDMTDRQINERELMVLRELLDLTRRPMGQLQHALLSFAMPEDHPDDRSPRNPVRRLSGWIGGKIQDRLLARARRNVVTRLGEYRR